MRKIFLVFSLFFLCRTIVAQEEIVFTPQWTAQAQFAGYYVAQAKGFYKDEGLKVRINHPSASNPCINQLKNGNSQIITLQLPTAMQYIDKGLHLVNVLQVFQNNSQMIVSHKPLRNIRDLNGKKVGIWHAGFSELAYSIVHKYNLKWEWVPFIQNVNIYVSGAVDATLAQSYNEFFQLKLAGQRFKDSQLIYFADIGFNIPEDGLYVTADYLRNHRQQVNKFVKASRRGWEWAVEHPEETIDIVMSITRANGIKTNYPAQRWMLQQVTKLLIDRKTGKRTYRLEPAALELANQLMKETSYLSRNISYKEITEP